MTADATGERLDYVGMSIVGPGIHCPDILTSSMILHMAVEMIFGTERCILLTALPATNECAVGRFRRNQSAGVIFDMVVQMLDGSKNTIARSGRLLINNVGQKHKD